MKSGFLLIDKKEGMTSQHIDYLVKKNLDQKKVGHLGTLDPFATGLLLIGVNDATKLFPFFEDSEKTYTATLTLGKQTDTLDCFGKIINEQQIKPFSRETIKTVLNSFLGEQEQIPPKYSAIHIDGKRAYELAQKNISFEMKKRKIKIYSLDLLSYDENSLSFRAKVSKGTYIRTLGQDIASKLGNLGYLTSLRRNSIGTFDEKDALQIEKITAESLIPMNKLLKFPTKEIEDSSLKFAENGNRFFFKNETHPFLFLSHKNHLLGLYKRKDDGYYYCHKGFTHE